MKLNQAGVSRVTAIIVAVIMSMIVVSYIAFNNDSNQTPSTTSTDNNLPSGYTRYSSQSGKFSVGYPVDWLTPDNADECPSNILLLAADPDYLGICGTDQQSQIYIASFEGDLRDTYTLVEGRGYSSASAVPFKLSGVTGLEQTGIAQTQSSTGALEDGSPVKLYTFYTKGRTYVAQYVQPVGALDYQDTFDRIVKTLRFRP